MATTKVVKQNKSDVFDSVVEEVQTDEKPTAIDDGETPQETTDLVDEAAVEPADAAQDGEPEADDVPGDRSDGPAPGRRWLPRALVGSAVVVGLAVVGMTCVLGWQVKQQNDIGHAGKAALTAAQSYAVTLTSIDPANVDANFDQVLNGATGEFKDMYSQSASQLRQVLIDNKATSKGIVVDSAIKSASKTKVEVLLFIDQSITNTVNPQPRIDRSRVAMTMEFIDSRWLASKVDIK